MGELADVLRRVIETGRVTAAVDGTEHQVFPVAIHPREGDALRAWVERERPERSIEIGLGYGVATLFILQGLRSSGRAGARHVVLDPNQTSRFAGIALQLLAEAGVRDRVELHETPSETLLPRLLAEGRRFDFAFVDGNHRFDAVFCDLMYLGRLLAPGRAVFLDDYQLPAIRKAARFCVTNLGWSVEDEGVADAAHHWVVLRTAAVPLERRFDHFVDF